MTPTTIESTAPKSKPSSRRIVICATGVLFAAALCFVGCSPQPSEEAKEPTVLADSPPQQAPIEKVVAEKAAPVPPVADPRIVFDSLQAAPTAPWEWVRESPAAHRSSEAGLQIMIEPGDLMGAAKNAKNIPLRPLPQDAKKISVLVDAQHKSQFEQAGLILYTGDDDYVKIIKEQVDGKQIVVMVAESGAKANVGPRIPTPEGTVCLVLELDGGIVKGYAFGLQKPNEIIEVFQAAFPMEPRPRVGLFTQRGEEGAERWATFRDFSIYNN